MTQPRAIDIAGTIRACLDAYRTGDRAAIERVLAPELRFTSPYDDAIDRQAYFDRCWPNHDRFAAHEVECVATDGPDAAFVTYVARLKDGDAFRNTEYMTFDAEGRIATIHVYFGETFRDGAFVAKRTD